MTDSSSTISYEQYHRARAVFSLADSALAFLEMITDPNTNWHGECFPELGDTVMDARVIELLRRHIKRSFKDARDDPPPFLLSARKRLHETFSSAEGKTVRELAEILPKLESEYRAVLIKLAGQHEGDLQARTGECRDDWERQMRCIGDVSRPDSSEIAGTWHRNLIGIGALPVREQSQVDPESDADHGGDTETKPTVQQKLGSIPPLDTKSGEWILASDVKKEYPRLDGVSEGNLANLRTLLRDAAIDEDAEGPKGIDRRDRVFRKEPGGLRRVWYFRSSLE